jgi:MFS family permease
VTRNDENGFVRLGRNSPDLRGCLVGFQNVQSIVRASHTCCPESARLPATLSRLKYAQREHAYVHRCNEFRLRVKNGLVGARKRLSNDETSFEIATMLFDSFATLKSSVRLEKARTPSRRSLWGLDWLNFFLADVQTGVGPFVAVYLAASHWSPEHVGIALTASGLAGVLAQAPGGALVDSTPRKRLLLAIGVGSLVVAALSLALHPAFPIVVPAQILLGATGAMIGPAVASMTLGLVGPADFDRRFGRNQAFNSAGNIAAALLMGGIGYALSNRAIFFAVPLLAIPCLLALSAISPGEIDYARSRGARNSADGNTAVPIRAVLADRKVICFAVCAILFHFANAAMLPQLGEMLAHGRVKQSAPFMSACVIVTQTVIAMTATWIGRIAAACGRRPLLLIGFGVLPVRGILYTLTSSASLLIGIQILDGIANAIFGVVSILVVADLTRGTGRFNVTQGALGAAVGIGASFSNTVAGFIAQRAGYSASFLFLAGVAALAWILLFALVAETKPDAAAQGG